MVTHQEVGEEEEAEPVGEHLLCHCLSATQQQFRVGLADCMMHYLTQEGLQDTGGGARGRGEGEGRGGEGKEEWCVCVGGGGMLVLPISSQV